MIYNLVYSCRKKQLLRYAAGSSVIPPLGLKKVKVRICDSDGIQAATCVNTLQIPNL